MSTLGGFAGATGLTVGSVASLIALFIFLIKFLSPQLIVFIYSGLLGDRNTAATWTVAGRTLHGTYWPEVLRSDAALSSNVSRPTALTAKLLPVVSVLIAVAGIVTPLGLYEGIWSDKANVAAFQYASDPSVFGQGTPTRSTLGFNRQCGALSPVPCPLSNTKLTFAGNDSYNEYDGNVDVAVPPILQESYSSGSAGTTISSSFDIEWRQWSTQSKMLINSGKPYLTGSLRQLSSVVLNDAIKPVEGLIVDTVNGRVGFRNHTVPAQVQQSASWTEDILFIEPESVCVNNNLTIDFTITGNNSIGRVVMTDRGGFAELNRTWPAWPDIHLYDFQADPLLARRAYKAAWMINADTMLYLNVTNSGDAATGRKPFSYMRSEVGKEFGLRADKNETSPFSAIKLDTRWGAQRGLLGDLYLSDEGASNVSLMGLSTDNWTDISLLCRGAGGSDKTNISNIGVTCGLMYGAAQRTDAGSGLIFEEGSSWTMPIYSCATATKASVKEVAFNQTATPGLAGLSVTSVRDKTYEQPEDMPLWGVEDSGMNFSQIQPLWGLVTPEAASRVKMHTRRGPSLYLPGSLGSGPPLIGGATTDNLPGASFHGIVAKAVYATRISSSGIAPGIDYTGFSNLAMWARWQQLSGNAATVSRILNLIWTDYAASLVVGTKGALGPGNAGIAVPILVTPSVARVSYNWPYAIPALLVALLFVLSALAAVGAAILGRASLATLRRHLHQTSPGRVFTACLAPAAAAAAAATERDAGADGDGAGEREDGAGAFAVSGRRWMRGPGGRGVDLRGATPLLMGMAEGYSESPGAGREGKGEAESDASAAHGHGGDGSTQPLKSDRPEGH